MAAMRSLPPWMYGEEKERMRRYRTERAELLVQGHDPDAIMDRWEDEQERRKISSGRRVRCVVEKVGDVFYVRRVVEDVEEIHEGCEKETANGDAPAGAGQIGEEKEEKSAGEAPACAVAAGQPREEKEAANGDVTTGAQIREMQVAGDVVGGSISVYQCIVSWIKKSISLQSISCICMDKLGTVVTVWDFLSFFGSWTLKDSL